MLFGQCPNRGGDLLKGASLTTRAPDGANKDNSNEDNDMPCLRSMSRDHLADHSRTLGLAVFPLQRFCLLGRLNQVVSDISSTMGKLACPYSLGLGLLC